MWHLSVFGQSSWDKLVKLASWSCSRIRARFASFRNGAIYESYEKDDRPA
jgi:hypothetical protein